MSASAKEDSGARYCRLLCHYFKTLIIIFSLCADYFHYAYLRRAAAAVMPHADSASAASAAADMSSAADMWRDAATYDATCR